MLYTKIKKNIEKNHSKDLETVSTFVEDLPVHLRKQLTVCIYYDLYTNVAFLHDKRDEFKSWICPILK